MTMSRPFRIALVVTCALVLLYLILPILIIAPMSFSAARYLSFPPPRCRCAGTRNMSAIRPGCRRPA
jgi:ABC-type spermidine/putrescine transport system, permease component II